jgi:glutamate racemase
LVEDGITGEDDVAVLSIAERYLSGLRETGIDTLIMGCTHYPLLRGAISKVMGHDVKLIDSGAETAKLVAVDLGSQGLLAQRFAEGTVKYFVTDNTEDFSEPASRFLESDVRGLVEKVTLE